MSQVLDLPVRATPLLGDAPTPDEVPAGAPVDDVVVVFERNVPVAGGSFHARVAHGPARPGDARVAELTGVWAVPGRRRRDRIRRALAALESSAATAGFARLQVAVDPARTDALALLRERRFTLVTTPDEPSSEVELEKRLA
ncbi:N-acetyltransferase domain-containing protein OS=Cellulomonas persica OX=76861 GN=CPE01_08160 PE=4 SV=1 [Cellulomonas persica]|uniref:N-acetyltransferase domain-containing protein n=1 Tax=Cellulomonas persica TaxID=76861 RepID=A0A510UQZ1_9CELL|nr:hypothetical protein CPE01_08160 [Cellulomonas persica]